MQIFEAGLFGGTAGVILPFDPMDCERTFSKPVDHQD